MRQTAGMPGPRTAALWRQRMLREGTAFARKIIDFYADRGIECWVVDEHLSLLVTLSAAGEIHEFRYGSLAFAGAASWKTFCQVLERELDKLKAEVACQADGRGHLKPRRSYEGFSAL